ncbi:Xanthine dehydrogenase accessory protein XdhC [Sulfitobacter noctilucicola]|nr:Xanthine dehydrogenase accessory protein XdhC [Sulfitobacter noctilucicola]
MKVTPTGTRGTIGGGTLEYMAIATARAMLTRGETAHAETLPLGPNLGQCCGGVVTLRYTDEALKTDPSGSTYWRTVENPPPPRSLWLWGAGHVGRAIVASAPPQMFDIHWIDSAANRFPRRTGAHVTCVPVTDMPRLAAQAPLDADHLIFTYSHDIDFELCGTLLQRGAKSIGLIGSATKWARFRKRLQAMGLDPKPITCPIGDKSMGKAPAQIAKGTIAKLMARPHPKASA